MSFFISLFSIYLVLITCGISYVFAQNPPDAGALRQQVEQEQQKVAQDRQLPILPTESAQEEKAAQDTLKVTVKSFRFEGNILFSDEQLAAAVAKYLDRPITYAQLQEAAAAVGEAYRKKGWAVRTFLPKQDIVDGIVVINIIEARFGKVRIDQESHRWPSQDKIKAIIAAQQVEDKPLNTKRLERSLLILDDVPGVSAGGRLQEGEQEGQTDLIIKTVKEPLISGALILDNEGSRSTNENRAHSFFQVTNPFSIGDQTSAYVLYSEGLRFARFEETLPIGDDGWRIGANTSVIDYEVLPSEFESLDAKGKSTSVGAQASYPLMRTRQTNLYLNLNYDHRFFENLAQGSTSSKYMIDNYSFGLRGNRIDEFAGGGSTTAGLNAIFGRLDLGAINVGEDNTVGKYFQKMLYNVSRLQTLIANFFLYGSFAGQVSAEKRLDSSEKFYLGGPNGVRAYPISEGGGVEGQMLKTELRWKFAKNYQLTGFYDYGHVHNPGNIQSYSLKGAGLELAWQYKYGLSVRLTWAHRIGDNPNPTTSGNDQDGSLKKDRFWLQITKQF